ncbi:hypothetical protein Tco_0536464 [Tanacetum coccineum]
MFRMNILTLIANTLGSCDNSSTLKFTVLKNVFEGDDVSDIDPGGGGGMWGGTCSYILECASESKLDWSKIRKKKDVVYYGPMMFFMKSIGIQKLEHKALKKREVCELENDCMGIGEIIEEDVGEQEETEQKEEYELIEEGIQSISIGKAEIQDKINENLIKLENDERLIQIKEMMMEIFKDPYIPEYKSSSESECDDDEDDNSQVGDENDKSYGTQTNLVEEDHVQIVTEAQQEERNNLHYTTTLMKKTMKKDSPVFGIDNSHQGSQLTFDLSGSPTEEVFNDDECMILFRMNILSLAPRLEIDIQVPGILEDKTKEIENKIDAQYVHEMLSTQMQNDVEKNANGGRRIGRVS